MPCIHQKQKLVCEAYLVEWDNLAIRLLDLSQLSEEIPESWLGDNIIGSEDAHPVELGGRVGLAGQMAPDDLVFLETTWYSNVSIVYFSH